MQADTLADLRARLEKCEGPIDAVTAAGIANDLSPWATNSEEWHLFVKALGPSLEAVGAALALVERLLPGWHATVNWRDALDGSSSCVLWEFPQPCRRIPAEEPFVIMGRSTALAILLALIHALAAQPDTGGE